VQIYYLGLNTLIYSQNAGLTSKANLKKPIITAQLPKSSIQQASGAAFRDRTEQKQGIYRTKTRDTKTVKNKGYRFTATCSCEMCCLDRNKRYTRDILGQCGHKCFNEAKHACFVLTLIGGNQDIITQRSYRIARV
jgi:hypothetical protein